MLAVGSRRNACWPGEHILAVAVAFSTSPVRSKVRQDVKMQHPTGTLEIKIRT